MFELDLIRLINTYKGNSSNDNKKNIIELLKSNEEEASQFIENPSTDDEIKNLLNVLINEYKEQMQVEKQNQFNKNQDLNNSQDETNKIMYWYNDWKKEFFKKGEITSISREIIDEFINHYYPNRLDILLEILEVENESFFEDFKTMVQNGLRAKIASDIEFFLNNKYKTYSFFQRFKVKRKIRRILKQLSKYIFNVEEIQELSKWLK